MSTNVPVTVWQPATGNGEMVQGTEVALETISRLNLITLSGNQLVTKDSLFTQIPGTVWSENNGV